MPDLSAAPQAAHPGGRPEGGSAVTGPGITPGRVRNRWTLVLAGLGAFMAALDVVVVATALPTLQSHYASPATFIQGFRPAEWTAAAVAAAGVVAAVLAPPKAKVPGH